MTMHPNQNNHSTCVDSVSIKWNGYSVLCKILCRAGIKKVHHQGIGKTWKYWRKYAITISAKANSQRGNKQNAKEDLLILQSKNMIMENALHMRS